MIPDFFFPVYKDASLAERLYQQIRRIYPESRIVAITDGKPDQSFRNLKETMNRDRQLFIETDDRIKTSEYGGQWLHRLYYYALASTQSELLVRTEPDTFFWREFNSFPEVPAAGSLNWRYGYTFLRGGAILFQRTTIQQLFSSDVFLNPVYCNNQAYVYPRYSDPSFLRPGEEPAPGKIICSDLIQGHAMNQLNIPVAGWDEVEIQGSLGKPKIKRHNQYAMTHPHSIDFCCT